MVVVGSADRSVNKSTPLSFLPSSCFKPRGRNNATASWNCGGGGGGESRANPRCNSPRSIRALLRLRSDSCVLNFHRGSCPSIWQTYNGYYFIN
ncbi:Phosphofructokinase [Musa troglodytarum]|uniref:Phosphofructokinase n=1 Tax=Musa troglodytarum TaxID=320322 RepID=A0A9E7KJN5_9LILI|nr:Phosphofructokinase [Musa troglodytarum]